MTARHASTWSRSAPVHLALVLVLLAALLTVISLATVTAPSGAAASAAGPVAQAKKQRRAACQRARKARRNNARPARITKTQRRCNRAKRQVRRAKLQRQQRNAIVWTPASRATITPGVQMLTSGAQCTANFVFTDAQRRVYLGYAAHCAATGGATDINGCTTRSLPLGTRVEFVARGQSQPLGRGVLAYSSWEAMQRIGTPSNRPECIGNDFALVRVDAADVAKVNPSVPVWGGPTGVASGRPAVGTGVIGWGNSGSRNRYVTTRATVREGGNEWAFVIEADRGQPDGIPGDSGSGYLDRQGRAVGVLSTRISALLGLGDLLPGLFGRPQNGLGTFPRQLSFARSHSGIAGLQVARGTEPFRP